MEEVDTQLVPPVVAVLARVVAHMFVRVPVLRELLSHSSAVRSLVSTNLVPTEYQPSTNQVPT